MADLGLLDMLFVLIPNHPKSCTYEVFTHCWKKYAVSRVQLLHIDPIISTAPHKLHDEQHANELDQIRSNTSYNYNALNSFYHRPVSIPSHVFYQQDIAYTHQYSENYHQYMQDLYTVPINNFLTIRQSGDATELTQRIWVVYTLYTLYCTQQPPPGLSFEPIRLPYPMWYELSQLLTALLTLQRINPQPYQCLQYLFETNSIQFTATNMIHTYPYTLPECTYQRDELCPLEPNRALSDILFAELTTSSTKAQETSKSSDKQSHDLLQAIFQQHTPQFESHQSPKNLPSSNRYKTKYFGAVFDISSSSYQIQSPIFRGITPEYTQQYEYSSMFPIMGLATAQTASSSHLSSSSTQTAALFSNKFGTSIQSPTATQRTGLGDTLAKRNVHINYNNNNYSILNNLRNTLYLADTSPVPAQSHNSHIIRHKKPEKSDHYAYRNNYSIVIKDYIRTANTLISNKNDDFSINNSSYNDMNDDILSDNDDGSPKSLRMSKNHNSFLNGTTYPSLHHNNPLFLTYQPDTHNDIKSVALYENSFPTHTYDHFSLFHYSQLQSVNIPTLYILSSSHIQNRVTLLHQSITKNNPKLENANNPQNSAERGDMGGVKLHNYSPIIDKSGENLRLFTYNPTKHAMMYPPHPFNPSKSTFLMTTPLSSSENPLILNHAIHNKDWVTVGSRDSQLYNSSSYFDVYSLSNPHQRPYFLSGSYNDSLNTSVHALPNFLPSPPIAHARPNTHTHAPALPQNTHHTILKLATHRTHPLNRIIKNSSNNYSKYHSSSFTTPFSIDNRDVNHPRNNSSRRVLQKSHIYYLDPYCLPLHGDGEFIVPQSPSIAWIHMVRQQQLSFISAQYQSVAAFYATKYKNSKSVLPLNPLLQPFHSTVLMSHTPHGTAGEIPRQYPHLACLAQKGILRTIESDDLSKKLGICADGQDREHRRLENAYNSKLFSLFFYLLLKLPMVIDLESIVTGAENVGPYAQNQASFDENQNNSGKSDKNDASMIVHNDNIREKDENMQLQKNINVLRTKMLSLNQNRVNLSNYSNIIDPFITTTRTKRPFLKSHQFNIIPSSSLQRDNLVSKSLPVGQSTTQTLPDTKGNDAQMEKNPHNQNNSAPIAISGAINHPQKYTVTLNNYLSYMISLISNQINPHTHTSENENATNTQPDHKIAKSSIKSDFTFHHNTTKNTALNTSLIYLVNMYFNYKTNLPGVDWLYFLSLPSQYDRFVAIQHIYKQIASQNIQNNGIITGFDQSLAVFKHFLQIQEQLQSYQQMYLYLLHIINPNEYFRIIADYNHKKHQQQLQQQQQQQMKHQLLFQQHQASQNIASRLTLSQTPPLNNNNHYNPISDPSTDLYLSSSSSYTPQSGGYDRDEDDSMYSGSGGSSYISGDATPNDMLMSDDAHDDDIGTATHKSTPVKSHAQIKEDEIEKVGDNLEMDDTANSILFSLFKEHMDQYQHQEHSLLLQPPLELHYFATIIETFLSTYIATRSSSTTTDIAQNQQQQLLTTTSTTPTIVLDHNTALAVLQNTIVQSVYQHNSTLYNKINNYNTYAYTYQAIMKSLIKSSSSNDPNMKQAFRNKINIALMALKRLKFQQEYQMLSNPLQTFQLLCQQHHQREQYVKYRLHNHFKWLYDRDVLKQQRLQQNRAKLANNDVDSDHEKSNSDSKNISAPKLAEKQPSILKHPPILQPSPSPFMTPSSDFDSDDSDDYDYDEDEDASTFEESRSSSDDNGAPLNITTTNPTKSVLAQTKRHDFEDHDDMMTTESEFQSSSGSDSDSDSESSGVENGNNRPKNHRMSLLELFGLTSTSVNNSRISVDSEDDDDSEYNDDYDGVNGDFDDDGDGDSYNDDYLENDLNDIDKHNNIVKFANTPRIRIKNNDIVNGNGRGIKNYNKNKQHNDKITDNINPTKALRKLEATFISVPKISPKPKKKATTTIQSMQKEAEQVEEKIKTRKSTRKTQKKLDPLIKPVIKPTKSRKKLVEPSSSPPPEPVFKTKHIATQLIPQPQESTTKTTHKAATTISNTLATNSKQPPIISQFATAVSVPVPNPPPQRVTRSMTSQKK